MPTSNASSEYSPTKEDADQELKGASSNDERYMEELGIYPAEDDWGPDTAGTLHTGGGPGFVAFSGNDSELRYLRLRCATNLAAFNSQPLSTSLAERTSAWNELVDAGEKGDPAPLVKSPFYVDYGTNVHIAPSAFIHRNVYLGDNPIAPIIIGDGTFVGPNTHILTVKQEVDWRRREGPYGPSWVAPVEIGEDCYIGSNVTILPGVKIGNGAVVGAGSVCTHSIPSGHVAAGNPARVIRKVAHDVADAPGLQYEEVDGRVMVKLVAPKSCRPAMGASDSHLPSPTQQSDDPRLAAPVDVARPISNAENGFDESQDFRHAELELIRTLRRTNSRSDRLMESLHSTSLNNTRMTGVDALLLVAAVMTAWVIVHVVLY